MKILHLCLACFFPDNYSYQENMLPKFHKQLGYDVEVIASLCTFDKDGKRIFLSNGIRYINEHGIPVTRLDYKKPLKIFRKMKRFVDTYEAIERATPDILFIHGCQFLDMDQVVKYVKVHPSVTVYVDNHADFSNSGTNCLSRTILHKGFWRHSAHIINPYTTKFYGVLPSRVEWLKRIYKLPKEKCELLLLGADDDKVNEAFDGGWRDEIRRQYSISQDDFLIMSGGKIDKAKTQILLLMEAVKRIDAPKIRLIIFGTVIPELKDMVNSLVDGKKIQYIGWIRSYESYRYWIASDLVVFPGRHSVFWEQVVALGIPMVCKYWNGTTHINMGGNVIFLYKDSTEEIQNVIEQLLCGNKYLSMLEAAKEGEKDKFSYKNISKYAIGEETVSK
jgi:hypothetical protein